MRAQRLRNNHQRGAALIFVLWMSIFMALILASAVAVARGDARIAAARTQKFKIDQSLKSALEQHAYRIAMGEAAGAQEFRTTLEINGLTVETGPSDEVRKLDINLASESAIAALFSYLGAEPEVAAGYAARIADWRDEDDLARPNGAERRDYATAKNGEQIGNRPFFSISELASVLELPPALLACAAPVTTIFGDSGPAEEAFLTTLFGQTPDAAKATSRVRLGTSSNAALSGIRHSITAAVVNDDPSGDDFVLTGVFRVSGDTKRPVLWITQFQHTAKPNIPETCLKKGAF